MELIEIKTDFQNMTSGEIDKTRHYILSDFFIDLFVKRFVVVGLEELRCSDLR